ncbi:MAG: ionic transporter y4hA, partial [Propionibacteriaceae bacterium]|nr:ionic transporter y4hA [Propionibacteriaceae bacterium]
LASIGLTIPTMAIVSYWLPGPLTLGLPPLQIGLLVLSAAVTVLTVVPGRAKTQAGIVHLVLFATFIVLSILP